MTLQIFDGTSVITLVFCSLGEKPAVQGSASESELSLHLYLLFCPCLQVVLMAAVQPGDNVERRRRRRRVGWKLAHETPLSEKNCLVKTQVVCKNALDFANASLCPRLKSRCSPRSQLDCLAMPRSLWLQDVGCLRSPDRHSCTARK